MNIKELAIAHNATESEVERYVAIAPNRDLLIKQACILRGYGFEHETVCDWLTNQVIGGQTKIIDPSVELSIKKVLEL